jgi:hypothetical protein
MDQVKHPLDWWAHGGYDEVVRQTGWNLPRARREVRKVIKAYGPKPTGHAGYEALRQQVMNDMFTWIGGPISRDWQNPLPMHLANRHIFLSDMHPTHQCRE